MSACGFEDKHPNNIGYCKLRYTILENCVVKSNFLLSITSLTIVRDRRNIDWKIWTKLISK